jgi:RNA polymerase sigma-70 factor (ECF subfamily)
MDHDRQEELLALAGELRPDLHRYCARLMGSVIDGEDVVQDTLIRAFVALQDLEEEPPLRPWLFRIAHNRALDLLRRREVRMAEPIDAAADVADSAQPDPLEMLMRKEAVKTAVSRFVELPTLQRSVVILKDVLDESLIEIAALLDLTVDAVKGHLARGRAHLRKINAHGARLGRAAGVRCGCALCRTVQPARRDDLWRCWPTTSSSISRYLRFASAGGYRFVLRNCTPRSTAYPGRPGSRSGCDRGLRRPRPSKPSYNVAQWRARSLSSTTTAVRYVTADTELTLAPETKPARDGAAQ